MKQFEKINPAVKTSPVLILLTMVIPQLLLALFRMRDLYVIREAIQENHVLIYLNYLIFPVILVAVGLVLFFVSRKRNSELSRVPMLGYFLLQTAALVTFLSSSRFLIPEGVDIWIVPIGTFMMVQLASSMPGLFFGYICVANIRWFDTAVANFGASFGLFLGAPGFLFILGNAFPMWKLPEAFVIVLFVTGTLICAFAFLQMMLQLSRLTTKGWVATLLFAIAFPIGGLLLNRTIPFPADLQHRAFYALAVTNGLVLLWGCLPAAKENAWCAWITAFSYPFTCYFFILFLPFLPFSVLAMLAVGAGFLILTPAILFILHTRQLVRQFQALKLRFKRSTLMLGFLSAFLLVPASYVGRGYYHRHIFFKTLDRVYTSAVASEEPMPSPKVAAYALKKLKETKTGVYVPILSEAYNRIVFSGMVLPDSKIKQLEQLLLGEASEDWQVNGDFSFYGFFTDQSRRNFGRRTPRVPRNVSLTDTEVSSVATDGTFEATVLISMKEQSSCNGSEYEQYITIPDGVFISGYELKIGEEMVPARMSDRRAALWVYHMIRDSQRMDPGLIIYERPNRLRLTVFPFAANEERQCAIRFLYPEGMQPEVFIGNERVELPAGKPASTLITTAEGRQAICIPAKKTQSMNGVFRTLEKVPLAGTDETPGYIPEWDIKRKLVDYWASGEKQLHSVPWFATETEQPTVEFDRARWWLLQNPDSDWRADKPEAMEVIPFRCGDQVRVIPKGNDGAVIFDSSDAIDFKPDAQLGSDSRYAKAVDLWQLWWQTQLYPEQEEELRRKVLLAARELNILVPSTSFLAVETVAQSKALEEAEKKSLRSHKSLAFDEHEEKIDSPEPQMIILMLIILPIVHWIYRRRIRDA